jgi:hypothetical protein
MSITNEKSSLLDFGGNKSNEQGSIQCNYASLSDHSASDSLAVTARHSDEPGLPIPRAVFVVTNAALGAGMLAFPEAFGKTGGVPQALAVEAVSIAYYVYNVNLYKMRQQPLLLTI